MGLSSIKPREIASVRHSGVDARLAGGATFAATTLESRDVTVLDVYGDLFHAGARTLEERLPSPRGARHPVVVLRLRGKTAAGATLIDVLARYAEELHRADGRLYLTGIRGAAHRRLDEAVKLLRTGNVHIHEASAVLGESTYDAVADARAWLASLGPS